MGETSTGEVKWVSTPLARMLGDTEDKIEPKYSFLGERIRHVAPTNLQCSMFCGGKQCKYCNPVKFKDSEMAIKGLYSSWVTNKILATSRPSTAVVKDYNIIEQFKESGIASIINLQHSGEHAACGYGLEECGFSYIPQEFMDSDVFFYNFGWPDYGVRSLQSILDMVKVMDFAISSGKVAIHCHAGLGRTGVLIACYLVYSHRYSYNEAILKVRGSRPKAIQTRGQITCVKEFESYIRPMWVLFNEDGENTVTLETLMNYQRALLHGEEGRSLKFVPKLVFMICQRLLHLSDVQFDLSLVAQIKRFGFMLKSSWNSIDSRSQSPSNDNAACIKNENDVSYEKKDLHREKSVNPEHCEDSPYKHVQGSTNSEILNQNKGEIENDIENDSKSVDNYLDPLCPFKLKKGGIVLQPLEKSRKGYHKRTNRNAQKRNSFDVSQLKALQQEFKAINGVSGNEGDNANNEALHSIPSKTSFRRSSLRCDNISLASFSSSANESLSPPDVVLKFLAFRCADIYVVNQIERFKRKLNTGDDGWLELKLETNLAVLSGLLWSWLTYIQEPIIDEKIIAVINAEISNPEEVIAQFPRDVWKLIECFLILLVKLNGKADLCERVLRRFSVVLTGEPFQPKSADRLDEFVHEEGKGDIFLKFIRRYMDVLTASELVQS